MAYWLEVWDVLVQEWHQYELLMAVDRLAVLGLVFRLLGPWCSLVPQRMELGVIGGASVQRLVWCFP